MSNKPTKTLRDGAISATIWKNEGEKGIYYSVDLSRSYKNGNDEWKETNSYSGADLLKVSHLAARAYDEIAGFVEKDKNHDQETA